MKLKIASLQLESCGLDEQKALQKGEHFCRQAAAQNADLILFPEMWNIGYTPHHQEVWSGRYDPANPKHPELLAEWKTKSVPLNSPFVDHFRKLAAELKTAICITLMEAKENEDAANTALLIDSEGKDILTYSKVHTCDFSMESHLSPGKDFFTADLKTNKGTVKIGLMICYDRENPESARLLMLKGAELILVPNASELSKNRIAQIQTRSFENMAGIAVCNYAGASYGHSCAFDGMALGESGEKDMEIYTADKKEQILYAEYDLEKLRDYRSRNIWGNAFRKPRTYGALTDLEVNPPFIRKESRR